MPARTVVGVRQATAAETSASGVQQGGRGSGGGGGGSGGALVMEFTSELNARLVFCHTLVVFAVIQANS